MFTEGPSLALTAVPTMKPPTFLTYMEIPAVVAKRFEASGTFRRGASLTKCRTTPNPPNSSPASPHYLTVSATEVATLSALFDWVALFAVIRLANVALLYRHTLMTTFLLTIFTVLQVQPPILFNCAIITEVLRAGVAGILLQSVKFPSERKPLEADDVQITFHTGDISTSKHLIASVQEISQNCISLTAPSLWEYDRSKHIVISLNDTIKDRQHTR